MKTLTDWGLTEFLKGEDMMDNCWRKKCNQIDKLFSLTSVAFFALHPSLDAQSFDKRPKLTS